VRNRIGVPQAFRRASPPPVVAQLVVVDQKGFGALIDGRQWRARRRCRRSG
jgi:hypothetical protein